METVLFVCTANICRSPMAERMLAARLAARDLPVEVVSAGIAARVGSRAASGASAAAAHLGVSLDAHAGRALDAELVGRSDLVLAMERGHAREAAVMCPDAWSRTFTSKEAVRRAEQIGPRRAEEDLRSWAARLHAGRHPDELLGASADDDVDDPYGGFDGDYERTAAEIAELVTRLERLAWPAGGETGVSSPEPDPGHG